MPAPQQHPAMASHPTPSSQEVDIGLVYLLLLPRYCEIAADGEWLRHAFSLSRKPPEGIEVGCIARCLGLQAGKRLTLHVLALGVLARQVSGPVLHLVQLWQDFQPMNAALWRGMA